MKEILRLLLSMAVFSFSNLMWASSPTEPATTQDLLYIFAGGNDGAFPNGNLIFDTAGNLYGTTVGGGGVCDGSNCGTVFPLTPNSDGGWTESVLHAFTGGSDGVLPNGGLVFDTAGNLYGTTDSGGVTYGCCGTVFEMSPIAGGWTKRVIYTFNSGSGQDGGDPNGSMIFDQAGNLYGVAALGGLYGGGIVFELKRAADGIWHEQILHNFGNGEDGLNPVCNLIFDAEGNLYGTTSHGGAHSAGIVFELARRGSNGWSERVLYNFEGGNEGSGPYGGLVFDAAGNLYGETNLSGLANWGTVFELSPASGGNWKERILHVFSTLSHGAYPTGNLLFDSAGNLYGATSAGGTGDCKPVGCGLIFELSPSSNGTWKETILMSFSAATNGGSPVGGLIQDSAGNIYGSAAGDGYGTVAPDGAIFEISK